MVYTLGKIPAPWHKPDYYLVAFFLFGATAFVYAKDETELNFEDMVAIIEKDSFLPRKNHLGTLPEEVLPFIQSMIELHKVAMIQNA